MFRQGVKKVGMKEETKIKRKIFFMLCVAFIFKNVYFLWCLLYF